MLNNKDSKANNPPIGSIDPYILAEALIGRKIDRNPFTPASTINADIQSGYDDLVDVKHDAVLSVKGPEPDEPPKSVHVGCINPYALVEALLGRKIDKCSMNSVRIISDVLQTDYDELFDLKHNPCLYAGLRLNEDDRNAEELDEKDMKILNEEDLETPDLSQVRTTEDLEKLGMKDILQTQVKMARMQNGKLRLVLHAHDMGKTVSNSEVTMTLNELALPFRMEKGQWTPPNGSWQDMYQGWYDARRMINRFDKFHIGEPFGIGERLHMGRGLHNNCSRNKFDDPVQGAVGNSWLIAAIFSVFWANPSIINRRTQHSSAHPEQSHDEKRDQDERKRRVFAVKFHDKGGDNNAPTATVEVNYEIPVNNSDHEPIYARASDGCEIWPMLYEKAFAKWVTGTSSDRPDITQTHNGDPIKAMAQINGREPQYFLTEDRPAHELIGLVRSCSVNFKTINPMCAYTHASGNIFRGSNLVANHAYSVLGWSAVGQKQYLILRNPWGVTEPVSLTSSPGLLTQVEPQLWRPASLLDHGGVLALEASAFKEYFCCIGTAK
ncbi:cysteine proteinase [Mytilinidion resinicola]|uniref:Cysteine proteinase n=1 Tax=Mytilinidion resinicola TaxID=574789 RepID=A0A6A6YWB4_9PEZI|nr:cysteine proteinase [Mytilinidion resinicola]KAF2812284.1 cysteine proteinase [Mytilinidion resinicola]